MKAYSYLDLYDLYSDYFIYIKDALRVVNIISKCLVIHCKIKPNSNEIKIILNYYQYLYELKINNKIVILFSNLKSHNYHHCIKR